MRLKKKNQQTQNVIYSTCTINCLHYFEEIGIEISDNSLRLNLKNILILYIK